MCLFRLVFFRTCFLVSSKNHLVAVRFHSKVGRTLGYAHCSPVASEESINCLSL